jgi:hypothetical protein
MSKRLGLMLGHRQKDERGVHIKCFLSFRK